MSDRVDARVEEQREIAADRLREYTRTVEPDCEGTVPNAMTVLCLEYLLDPGYLEVFADAEYWHLERFADDVRTFMEREMVERISDEDDGLALGILFHALQDVDWVHVARSIRIRFVEQHDRQRRLEGREDVIAKVTTIKLGPNDPHPFSK